MDGQKRCSPRPALNYKSQRSQQFQILSEVQEVWLCLPEQRNVNHSLKQKVDLCVCMDLFVPSQLSILRQMPHFQSFLHLQTVSNPHSPEETFCLLWTKRQISCSTG